MQIKPLMEQTEILSTKPLFTHVFCQLLHNGSTWAFWGPWVRLCREAYSPLDSDYFWISLELPLKCSGRDKDAKRRNQKAISAALETGPPEVVLNQYTTTHHNTGAYRGGGTRSLIPKVLNVGCNFSLRWDGRNQSEVFRIKTPQHVHKNAENSLGIAGLNGPLPSAAPASFTQAQTAPLTDILHLFM